MPDPAHLQLPPSFRVLRERTRPGAAARLIEAELTLPGRAPQHVAVRLAPVDAAEEWRAELEVLSSVEHPGLTRPIDFGAVPGGVWVARRWVDGQELAEWARQRAPSELARLAAHLCLALEHLHERGFVYADLKASNVLVEQREGGAFPVLTDFGLSRRAGAATDGLSGTLFHIAPEVLAGAAPGPASDLFALGVMLHELALGRRPSAREFYGRFPTSDFFEATRTTPAELPEVLRELVVELVERDPSRRPPSAAEAGRRLARAGGVDDLFRERRVELRWPTSFGREEWLTHWSAGFARDDGALRLNWVETPADEDVASVLDACAMRAALSSGQRTARVQRLSLEAAIDALSDLEALDRWATQTADAHAGEDLFAALPTASPWRLRAIDALALAVRQAAPDRRPASLTLVAPFPPPPSHADWACANLPALDRVGAARFLRESLELAGVDVDAWAQALADAARGSTARADRLLQQLVRGGQIVLGERAPRLRPGAVAAPDLGGGDAAPTVEPELLAALEVAGRAASAAELAELLDTTVEDVARRAQALVASGAVRWERTGGGARLRATGAAGTTTAALELPRWRELHRRRAEQLERAHAAQLLIAPHRYRAGLADAGELAALSEELLEAGGGELALRLCEQAEAQPNLAPPARELALTRALAWCALGDADQADAQLAPWREPTEVRERAALLRARGQIASTRRDLQSALAAFDQARQLDPDDGGVALLAAIRVLGDAGRDGETLALLEQARRDAAQWAALRKRVRQNLEAREAVALFRTGRIDEARERLERAIADAAAHEDAAREAALRINLANLERRGVGLEHAREHFERALELYERSGNLVGLAQARAQFGGALRESGELLLAQPLLESALALRERLGERSGATAVRGMLGLLLADRGHVRAATSELERTASALREEGRSRAAVLLEARAVECRARCGDFAKLDAGATSEIERAAEGDPRILLSRARALAFRGELDGANELSRRAEALATRLGLEPIAREARYVAARLRSSRTHAAPDVGAALDLVAEDELIARALERVPLDAPELRERAADLRRRGRDDRAARVLLAVAARVEDDTSGDARAADEAFAACARGLSPLEQSHLRRALLGVPDAWPEDLIAHERRRSAPEDDEMEVIGLLDINRRLLAQEDLRTLLGTVVEQSLAVSGAQRGFLILEEEGELKVDTALDSRRGDLDAPDVEVSGSVLREALGAMQPVRVSNAVDDPQLGAAPSVIHLELRSILCVPFEVQPGLRGVIYVDHRLREAAFDARVERMLTLLANQAALAILQVRRLEEIRRLNRELGRQVARKESDLKTAAAALRRASLAAPGGGLVGDSPPMREVRRLLERAAPANLPVLITGPSGSGKELAARALHELSGRRDGPFVSENCAALPASLIEAELFGARRGAYTGADRDREGLFERAHGGTLFLDEIGELPLDLQAKLLRALETGEVRRLGDDKVRKVDVRLLAATNRELAQEVNDKRFRADLYYRLNGLSVVLPALSERIEDIPALVDHCLRLNAEPGKPPRRIAPAVLARLCRRAWPGNVRELFNEVARLLVMSEGDVSDPELVRAPQTSAVSAAPTPGGAVKPFEQLEKEAILHALDVAGGDKRKAAELLGISRAKVYQRLKDWGLTGGREGE